jgi:hypothetical protein
MGEPRKSKTTVKEKKDMRELMKISQIEEDEGRKHLVDDMVDYVQELTFVNKEIIPISISESFPSERLVSLDSHPVYINKYHPNNLKCKGVHRSSLSIISN